MKYKIEYYNNKEYIRINKKKVLNLLKSQKEITIYTLPINANPKSPWINGFFEIEKNQYRDYVDCINEINEIMYYNCNKELGMYLKFYILGGK